MRLRDSNVLITGASRGIGVVIAQRFAQQGANLVLAARSLEDLEQVRTTVEALGVRAACVDVDLADPGQIPGLAKRAADMLGPINILVNNAGFEQVGFYEELSPEQLQRSLAVNLTSPMLLAHALLEGMIARDRGHIVNVSSLAGLGPAAQSEPYGASKAGLIGFTRSLRTSLRMRGSRVSASTVAPGFVVGTGMFEAQRSAHSVEAPALLGTSTAHTVAEAVTRAIETNAPEIIVNGRPIRPLLALTTLFPRFMERVSEQSGTHQLFLDIAEQRRDRTE